MHRDSLSDLILISMKQQHKIRNYLENINIVLQQKQREISGTIDDNVQWRRKLLRLQTFHRCKLLQQNFY